MCIRDSFKAERAARGGIDHADILADGDERAGKAADVARRHHAALFHRVVEQCQRRSRAVTSARCV